MIGIVAIVAVLVVLAMTAVDTPATDSTAGEPASTASSSADEETSSSATPSARTTPRGTTPAGGGAGPELSDRETRRLKRLADSIAAGGIDDEVVLPLTFRLGTFNILGSQHTAPGGTKGGKWPSGAARLPGTIELIKAHNVSVAGLQEVQPEQLDAIVAGTGYAVYPGSDTGWLDRVNSIIYDPGVWEFVAGETFQMSNGTGYRAQPVLRLRHRETDREVFFVNTHPPSGDGALRAKRIASHNQLVSVVNRLKQSGLPVLMTGDMNDREEFFCRVLPPTGMVASAGGSTAGGCSPPALMPVDWVVGTSEVQFSDHLRDETPVQRRLSDHFFVSATATIAGRD